MDKLLSPDIGLSIWTMITFLLLVFILSKTAWKPLITALEEREAGLKAEREAAEAARRSAESLKEDLDRQLARIQARTQEALAAALRDGQKTKDQILKAAQEEAKVLLEKSRRQLEDEKERLIRELRGEVAGLTVLAAEKLLKATIDASDQKRLLEDFYKELEKSPKPN